MHNTHERASYQQKRHTKLFIALFDEHNGSVDEKSHVAIKIINCFTETAKTLAFMRIYDKMVMITLWSLWVTPIYIHYIAMFTAVHFPLSAIF